MKEIEKDNYNGFYKKKFKEFLDPFAHTYFNEFLEPTILL